MTEAMINKARINADKLGLNNVEFRLGEIESMPLTANRADVIVSNCVINLVPDKRKAFQEILRVLKPGGHFQYFRHRSKRRAYLRISGKQVRCMPVV